MQDEPRIVEYPGVQGDEKEKLQRIEPELLAILESRKNDYRPFWDSHSQSGVRKIVLMLGDAKKPAWEIDASEFSNLDAEAILECVKKRLEA
ncbi:hypothetical protein SH501x_000921 [Pirellulaceae bacterium SH501]